MPLYCSIDLKIIIDFMSVCTYFVSTQLSFDVDCNFDFFSLKLKSMFTLPEASKLPLKTLL